MFSHVENIRGIRTDETPKINTFQTMRKEVSGMAVFRIEKTRDYTVMSNHHLRNTDLSLKAKGLLSLMLSLPEEWDYTAKGLARICKDGVTAFVPGYGSWRITGMWSGSASATQTGSLGPLSTRSWSSPGRPNLNGKNLNGKIQFRQIQSWFLLSWENLNRKNPHN